MHQIILGRIILLGKHTETTAHQESFLANFRFVVSADVYQARDMLQHFMDEAALFIAKGNHTTARGIIVSLAKELALTPENEQRPNSVGIPESVKALLI